jgi:hypothetical protein
MAAKNNRKPTVQATLCEIERGLFYVTYTGHTLESDIPELPTYGLGTCAAYVKQRMEKTIRAFGYETVIWRDALVLPQRLSPPAPPPLSATQETPLSG